jgi:hypothetical protein
MQKCALELQVKQPNADFTHLSDVDLIIMSDGSNMEGKSMYKKEKHDNIEN